MERRIAIVGNCQARPLAMLLNELTEGIQFVVPPRPVHVIDDQEVREFLHSIKAIDLVISQPIQKGYRNGVGIDTDNIRKHLGNNDRLVLVPNVHFEGFCPTWGYMRYESGLLRGNIDLSKPVDIETGESIGLLQQSDYHCFLILYGYLNGIAASDLAVALSMQVETEFVRQWYEDSLREFAEREARCHTNVAEHLSRIDESPSLGFHSFNHPNKAMLAVVANEVLKVVEDRLGCAGGFRRPDGDQALETYKDAMDRIKLPVYGFVQASLSIQGMSDRLKIGSQILSPEHFVGDYYRYYDALDREALSLNCNHKKYVLSKQIFESSFDA